MTASQSMAVQHTGEGLPVLIIHGWTVSGLVEAADFEPKFTKNSGYHRVYEDLPGMVSSPADSVTNLDDMLEVVTTFIDDNVLPSGFLLVGTSSGAYLARALAFRYAGHVDGLLLRVPVIEPDSSRRDVDTFLPAIADKAMMSSLPDSVREQLGEITVQTLAHIEAVRQKLVMLWSPAVAAADSAVLDLIRNNPDLYRLAAPMHSPKTPFTKPTLIMAGRQDSDVGYRDAWTLIPAYTRATFAVLDRADHGMPVDSPELFQALARDWLWRVEDYRGFDQSG